MLFIILGINHHRLFEFQHKEYPHDIGYQELPLNGILNPVIAYFVQLFLWSHAFF